MVQRHSAGVGDTSNADIYVVSGPAGGIAFVAERDRGPVAVSDHPRANNDAHLPDH